MAFFNHGNRVQRRVSAPVPEFKGGPTSMDQFLVVALTPFRVMPENSGYREMALSLRGDRAAQGDYPWYMGFRGMDPQVVQATVFYPAVRTGANVEWGDWQFRRASLELIVAQNGEASLYIECPPPHATTFRGHNFDLLTFDGWCIATLQPEPGDSRPDGEAPFVLCDHYPRRPWWASMLLAAARQLERLPESVGKSAQEKVLELIDGYKVQTKVPRALIERLQTVMWPMGRSGAAGGKWLQSAVFIATNWLRDPENTHLVDANEDMHNVLHSAVTHVWRNPSYDALQRIAGAHTHDERARYDAMLAMEQPDICWDSCLVASLWAVKMLPPHVAVPSVILLCYVHSKGLGLDRSLRVLLWLGYLVAWLHKHGYGLSPRVHDLIWLILGQTQA